MPSGAFKVKAEHLDRDIKDEMVAKISAEYKRKEPKPEKPYVGPTEGLRERILRLSLFPNIFNKRSLESNY